MKYEPYNFDSFKELLKMSYNLGWYGGKHNLFTIRCEGEFEGFSHRASETWEQQFILTSDEIKSGEGKVIWPTLSITGGTIKEVCDKAIQRISKD